VFSGTGSTSICTRPDIKSNGPTCPSTSQPIALGTGNKWLVETDLSDSGIVGGGHFLTFTRTYNSNPGTLNGPLGAGWGIEYGQHLGFSGATGTAWGYRPDGRALKYLASGNNYTAEADTSDHLYRESTVGFRFETADNRIERYDNAGRLISVVNAQGLTQSFSYDAQNRLIAVADPGNRRLTFAYDAQNRITTLTDPVGRQTSYSYDAANNLSVVIYPDLKTKTYHYNESSLTGGANLPNLLTGITDENGVRYISYSYDSSGRAIDEISPSVGNNTNHYQLTYNAGSTTVTDPLGSIRTYNFQTVLGVARSTGSNQPGGAGCGPAASFVSYDANGNVAGRTDFDGKVTAHTYDLNRNLEVQRVEASGTAEARTISTQWHGVWRLPIKVAEPKKLSRFFYNGDLDNGQPIVCAPSGAVIPMAGGNQPIGVLCKQIEEATTDANGAMGFSAAIDTAVAPRLWSYTYDVAGRLVSGTDPLNRAATKAYFTATVFTGTVPDEVGHTAGDLQSITNAAGHVTQFTQYDRAGRVRQMVDPKSIVTDMAYTPRGWVSSVTVTPPGGAARTTAYTYDNVGQLIGVVMPDAATLTYSYDTAHRLTGVTDAKGNTVTYTLDGMGNKTGEQVKDLAGNLQRSITRVYDALNRVQQVTGASN
jgi:YD repeat-containing protein